MQHFVMECVKKQKTEKKDGSETYSATFSGETPNSRFNATLTVQALEEEDLIDFIPRDMKRYRVHVDEVVDEVVEDGS